MEGEKGSEKRERERERGKGVFRFSIRYMEIEPLVFVGAKGKVGQASRATRGYQNLGVSSNSTR